MIKMKPGKKLDALISEKIFNDPWPLEILYLFDSESCPYDISIPVEIWLCINYTSPEGQSFLNRTLLKYSLDIKAAWKVIEKLRENYTVDIHEYCDGWEVVLVDSQSNVFYGQADTAPHAICLAALSFTKKYAP